VRPRKTTGISRKIAACVMGPRLRGGDERMVGDKGLGHEHWHTPARQSKPYQPIHDLIRNPHHVVIVGGGSPVLFFALKLAPRPVALIAAAPRGEGAIHGPAQCIAAHVPRLQRLGSRRRHRRVGGGLSRSGGTRHRSRAPPPADRRSLDYALRSRPRPGRPARGRAGSAHSAQAHRAWCAATGGTGVKSRRSR